MNHSSSRIEAFGEEAVVVIGGVKFKGRQHIDWKHVENYLKKYVGDSFEILASKEVIHIGKEFADEFSGSAYTSKLKGALAKAKANSSLGIPEMIKIAVNKRYKENLAKKHQVNAKYGWYRYTSRFAIPISDERGEAFRYNIYRAELLVRHDADGKLYLYDIVNIKKERSTPLRP